MRKRIAAVLGLVLMAACESTPTTTRAEAAGAALNGGVVFGSGNRSDSTANDNTARGGGLVVGSGN